MNGSDKDRGLRESIDRWERCLKENPSSRIFAPLSDAYRKIGELDRALEIAREGVKRNPDYIGGRVALARIYRDKGMFREAIEELRIVVERSPENIAAIRLIEEIGDYSTDAEIEASSSNIHDDNEKETITRVSNNYYNLTFASILERQGCLKEAEDIYRAMLNTHPEKRDILIRRLERLKTGVDGSNDLN